MLLTSITPPSDIGVTFGYLDNKVVSIIDKAAISRQTTIAYHQMQTVVTDTKTNATSIYVFADNQKVRLVGETHNSNQQTRYITYGRDEDPETFEYVLEQESYIAGITHNSYLRLCNYIILVRMFREMSGLYGLLEN